MLVGFFVIGSLAWSAPPPRLSRRNILAMAAGGTTLPVEAFEPDIAIPPVPTDPQAAKQLLSLVRGRRPSEWRDDERAEVDALIEELAKLQAPWRACLCSELLLLRKRSCHVMYDSLSDSALACRSTRGPPRQVAAGVPAARPRWRRRRPPHPLSGASR